MGKQIEPPVGFLGRLGKSQAGSTLAMVAAAIIPLAGLAGGGIDMARLYLTKARLQQACDAGALGGRKQMGAGAWSANSNKANAVALELFDANFGTNPYGTNTTSRSFTESSGKVTGTASVIVPMTVMKIFGQTNKTISITCDAEMRIPNTDVMFVLDTTGSMDETIPGDTVKKIVGLRKAVKCFYEALAKIDIDNVDCGSTPTGGNSATVQLRFGFVPYATNVNVGKLLNNSWMEDTPFYQTRVPQFTPSTSTSTATGTPTLLSTQNGSWSSWSGSTNANYSGYCDGRSVDGVSTGTEGSPYGQTSTTSGNTTTTTWYTDTPVTERDYSNETQFNGFFGIGRQCVVTVRTRSYNITKQYRRIDTITTTTTQVFSGWIYKKDELDVRGLKAGGYSWNDSVMLPVGTNGTSTSISWDGCIEERQPFKNSDGNPADDYDPIPSSAFDMDIDSAPTSDRNTQWKPLLRDVVWGRVDGSGNKTRDPVTIAGNWSPNGWTTYGINDMPTNRNYYCPRPARKMGIYKTSAEVTDFKTYVDALTPDGNTYHDIGLIWGARLMSPTGLFASENALTPNGGTIERHMIFMTDGTAVANNTDYVSHGLPWWDQRQTNATDSDTLVATINARLVALCSAIKNKNITLWVIYYGAAGTDDYTRLENCASSGRFYNATNSTLLIDKFKSIADEISQLRLTN
ncbi:Tad domain-containing protein [Sphingobium sp. AN641]|uniref:Tad domain-containing protein n=1 Tax=Sphingobium sp. AN641 TaxID=3133443 RepID=UPI0030C2C1EF